MAQYDNGRRPRPDVASWVVRRARAVHERVRVMVVRRARAVHERVRVMVVRRVKAVHEGQKGKGEDGQESQS